MHISDGTIVLTAGEAQDIARTIKLALPESMWNVADRAFVEMVGKVEREEACPFTFSHTRHWCGYNTCRDS